MKNFLILCGIWVLVCLMIAPIQGAVLDNSTVTVSDITDNSIRWGYTYDNPIIYASLDGRIIEGFDNQSQYYRAESLTQNVTHTFCIYSEGESNCEPAITTALVNQGESFFSFFNFWIYALFALLFVVIAVYTGIPFISLAGTVCAFIGLIASLGSSFAINLLFVIVFIITLYVGLKFD